MNSSLILLIAILSTFMISCTSDSDKNGIHVKMELPQFEEKVSPFASCEEMQEHYKKRLEQSQVEYQRYSNWISEQHWDMAMPIAEVSEGTQRGNLNEQEIGVGEFDIVQENSHHFVVARTKEILILDKSRFTQVQKIEKPDTYQNKVYLSDKYLISVGQLREEESYVLEVYRFKEGSVGSVFKRSFQGQLKTLRFLPDNKILLVMSDNLETSPLSGGDSGGLVEKPFVQVSGKIGGVHCQNIYRPALTDLSTRLTKYFLISNFNNRPQVYEKAFLGNYEFFYVTKKFLYMAMRNPNWFHWESRELPVQSLISVVDLFDGRDALNSLSVVGQIKDRWSLKALEGGDYLSVTSTLRRWGGGGFVQGNSENYLNIYSLRSSGEIENISSLGPFAPGEQIMSTRYVGTLAFVVTFRTIDPLFKIELSDPFNPRILQELKIPGFSSYLQPIGEDLLVGVGEYWTPDGGFSDNSGGVQLSLYRYGENQLEELDRKVYGQLGSFTPVTGSPKSLYVDASRQRLALPIIETSYNSQSSQNENRSGVIVYEYSKSSGYIEMQWMSHDEWVPESCSSSALYPQGMEGRLAWNGIGAQRVVGWNNKLISISPFGLKLHSTNHELKSYRFENNQEECEEILASLWPSM